MKRILWLLIVIVPLFLGGCSKAQETAIGANEVDKIVIKVTNVNRLPEGNAYTLKLVNSGLRIIKQNAIYLSYPVIKGTGSSWNKCKVEASGNKLNIKPKEEVVLNVFMQKEIYETNKYLDIEHPEIEIVGYIDEVTELNRFQKLGNFEFFDKNGLSKK